MPHTARRLPRPTTGSERRLILAARRGDATAQARVLSQYEPMMRLIARRLYLPGGEHDDLAQEARVGLVDAMRTWDPAPRRPVQQLRLAVLHPRSPQRRPRRPRHQASPPHHGHTARRRRRQRQGRLHRRRNAPRPPRERRSAAGAFATQAAASAHGGDDDPVAKTLAREQLRALIARTRTLSPLERRALMLANNDHSHSEIAATLHIRDPSGQQRAPARAPQAARADRGLTHTRRLASMEGTRRLDGLGRSRRGPLPRRGRARGCADPCGRSATRRADDCHPFVAIPATRRTPCEANPARRQARDRRSGNCG